MDFLNPRWGVWPGVREVLGEHYPYLLDPWRRFLYDEPSRERRMREVQATFDALTTSLALPTR